MPLLGKIVRFIVLALTLGDVTAATLPKMGRSATQRSAAGEWKEAVDPSSGRTYYWNTETRESRWSKPVAPAPPAPISEPAPTPTPTPTPTPKAMLKPTLKPKLMPTPAQASASPEAAAATVVRAARDADAVEEEAEQEEEYTPGEADFEEYTQSNPSRPRHLRLRSWVANRANAALGIHASPAVHGGMRSVVKDTERSALLQGVYLGSALVAAVAFL